MGQFVIKRHLGLLLILALVVMFFPVLKSDARPDSLKDVLTDSRPSVVSNHTITYDQNGTATFGAGDTITVDFDNSFDTSLLADTEPEDFDFKVASTDETVVSSADSCGDDEIEVTSVNTSTDTIVFTACTGYTA